MFKGKVLKSLVCLVGVLCLIGLESSSVKATEVPVTITSPDQLANIRQYDTNGDGLVYATIRTDNIATSLAYSSQNGEVTDNGVRLRAGSSTTATILELMYSGEAVCINFGVSGGYNGWYYLQRLKTGTWGWASSSYIDPWY